VIRPSLCLHERSSFPTSLTRCAPEGGPQTATSKRKIKLALPVPAKGERVRKFDQSTEDVPFLTFDDWDRLTIAERVSRCRSLAEEATRLSESDSEDVRNAYLDLARQWEKLAEQIERRTDSPVTRVSSAAS
jgi:hypothetical protein